MMRSSALFLALAIAGASGCAQMQAISVRPMNPIDEASMAYAMREGSGSIEGQGFLRTVGGDVKYAAGSAVTLIAATPYVDECIRASHGAAPGQRVECDQKVKGMMRTTQADGEGRFAFDRVATGRYYVETYVSWSVPSPHGYFGIEQGGFVSASTDVRDGDVARVILTR